MAIVKGQIAFYREIFRIPGVLSEPFLMIGYQDICGKDLPGDFDYKDVKGLLASKGVKDVRVIDFFDERADLKYDLNLPVPEKEDERYNVLMDIGTLEHIFDTRQCLESCLRMVKVNGLYILHTAVNGYFKHGLYVFNPDCLIEVLRLNNFEILYLKYSTQTGQEIKDPSKDPAVVNNIFSSNLSIWIVAKKLKCLNVFQFPQQKRHYKRSDDEERPQPISLKVSLKRTAFKILQNIWNLLVFLKSYLKRFLTG